MRDATATTMSKPVKSTPMVWVLATAPPFHDTQPLPICQLNAMQVFFRAETAKRCELWYNMHMVLKNDPKAYAIMGCAMRVHSILGFGFLESAYGDALEMEFKKSGIPYVREDSVRIFYDGQPLPTKWRADFTCFGREYIVELKAIKAITKIEWAQVIHYMRATRIPRALLLNFGRQQLQYDTFDLDSLPFGPVLETAGQAPTNRPSAQQTVQCESKSRSPCNSAER